MPSNVARQLPPPWLDREYLENMLRKSENDESIRVKSVNSKAALPSGDNYMSEILRISLEYTRELSGKTIDEKKSLIFKVELEKNTFTGDLSKISGVFNMEMRMMTSTLIKMTEALNEKDVRFCARVYDAKIGDPSYLALEDLGALGFRMADRRTGLDLGHCRLVIQRLAKFHASSVAICEKSKEECALHDNNMWGEKCPEQVQALVRGAIVGLAMESGNWPELDPCVSKKLCKLADVCRDKMAEYTAPKEEEFNVINHADCWLNNMLFRYNDKGEIIDHIFVDFQLSTRGSPAVDLIYFLSTSAIDDVFYNHWDELIDEYLDTLTRTMSRIGCTTKPPTSDSLRKSLRERHILKVIYSILCLPFVLLEESKSIEFNDLLDPERTGNVNPGHKGQHFRERITKRLKIWDSRRLLDV